MLTNALSMCENENEQQFISSMYEEYKYIMIKTARKFESDPDAIDDLIQDALVKLIKKVSVLMSLERCTLVSYIVYTVRNTAINRLRHKTVVNRYIDDQELTEDLTSVNVLERSVEDRLLLSFQADELQRILAMLPENDQILLQGKYQLQLSDFELADILQCNPGSIRMMLTRARRKALELLKKEGFSYGNT